MKPANIAPFYGCLYPTLCDVARSLGYALTIHGSVVTDLDFVAIPWNDSAVGPQELRDKMAERIGALDYRGLLERDCPWFTTEQIDQLLMQQAGNHDPEIKPHGRLAWNLYLHAGVKIDLSVMPRLDKREEPPATRIMEAREAGIAERARRLAVFFLKSANPK